MRYYVYGYFREDGTPYYIGKGHGRRAWNKHKRGMLPKDPSRIKILLDRMNEKDALEAERDLISLLGRKDLGTGCLCNLTDGGEGTAGRFYSPSSQHREALSLSMKGKSKSPSHKTAISSSLRGKKKTASHRAKISRARSTSRNWTHEKHGLVSCSAQELALKYDLHTGALSNVARGYSKQHKGWRLA